MVFGKSKKNNFKENQELTRRVRNVLSPFYRCSQGELTLESALT